MITGPCPYNCHNKTLDGYCKTTACIYPVYGNYGGTSTSWKIPDFEPVYNPAAEKNNKIARTLAKDTYQKVKYSKENKTSLVLTCEESQLILDLLETLI